MSLWGSLLSVLSAIFKRRTETTPVRVGLTIPIKRTGYVRPEIADFFAKIRAPALAVESETGIPWTFAATQAGHESRWGQSKLTVAANNLFGFTANDAWVSAQRPTAKFLTREDSPKPPEQIRYWQFPGDVFSKDRTASGGSTLQVWRHFRKYATWEESIRDWANLLAKPRFARALAGAKAGNFAEFAQGLEDAQYATHRDETTGELIYADLLVKVHKSIEGIA
jgi:flagellum-specific peptidoglycan hydrolase FlgJ